MIAPVCKCGKPLKVFSSGKAAKACGKGCYPSYNKPGYRPPAKAYTYPCKACGRDFITQQCGANRRKYCSAGCRPDTRLPPVECKGCGAMFKPRHAKYSSYCSRECSFAHKGNRNRPGPSAVYLSQRAINARRRSLLRAGERINPLAVFDRDGWMCQLCGIPTPKEKRGTIESNAPEVDHIIPLSKGGAHTWGNVQCACRRCNNRKSNKVLYKSAA